MGIQSTALSLELVKLAALEGKRNYLGTMALMAPAAVASSLVDFPKGTIEKAVESRVGGGPKVTVSKLTGPKPYRPPAWHRGVARMGARLPASLATLPVFLDGIKDIKEGNTSKGALKVVGSGIVYSGVKGGLEGKIEKRLSPEGLKKTLRSPKNMAKVRGSLGALASLATAVAIAKSSDKGEKKKKGRGAASKFILPVAVGAVGGGLKGGIEELYDQRKRYGKIKTPRRIRGAIAGRASAGIIGAAALTHIAGWAMKKSSAEKTERSEFNLRGLYPAVPNEQVRRALDATPAPFKRIDMGPKPGDLYYQTMAWAGNQANGRQAMQAYRSTQRRGDPEGNPTRRAVYYALHDDLTSRGHDLPALSMRSQVSPPMTKAPGLVEVGAIAALLAAPEVVWHNINKISTSDKDKVLQEAMDRIVASKGILRLEANEDFWNEGVKAAKERYKVTGEMDPAYLKRKWAPLPTGEPVATSFPGPHAGTVDTTTTYRDIRGSEISAKGTRPYIGVEKAQKPFIVAHELGHATAGTLRKGTLQSALAERAYGAARLSAIALPLAALAIGYDSSFATAEELESRANFSKAVGGVAALMAAPRLAEEVVATGKGIKYLAKARAFGPDMAGRSASEIKRKTLSSALRRGSRLLPAFGTYAAPIAVPFLVAKYLSSKAKKARRQQAQRR